MTRRLAGVNESPAMAAFCRRFPGAAPTAAIVVPGRVNLIGEHVDYCGGIVLPMAVSASLRIMCGPQSDPRISLSSESHGEFECELADLERRESGWAAYAVGVALELRSRNVALRGAAICIDGALPSGVGLASSAAFCAGVGMALLHAAGAELPLRELAEVCRDAEHRAVGVPCGIMDPLVCLAARQGAALRIDCRWSEFRPVRWPDGDLVAIVVDSRLRRELSDSSYAARVNECREAAWRLAGDTTERASLRDVSVERLDAAKSNLGPTLYRRARHVVTEIDRVDRAADALESGELDVFGRLMNESHASLREDFECCPPQVDDLARIVRECPGVYGTRMTGGGFGGCVVALAGREAMHDVERAVRNRYDGKYGVTAQLWCCTPCQGATLTPLTEA
jgi:galactokinase